MLFLIDTPVDPTLSQTEDDTMNEAIILEDFAQPEHTWYSMNDPVMGGQSFSSFEIDDGLGIFDGECKIVPFLQAPGFITVRGEGNYPDVSSCASLRLTARTSVPYDGYRISFGNKRVPGNRFARGFKANFDAPVGNEMGVIDIPFKDFTVRWDDKTGEPIVKCTEDESFCPDLETLQNMKRISIWGEGVAGSVHLELKSITATGCSTSRSEIAFTRNNNYQGNAFSMMFVLVGVIVTALIVSTLIGRKSSKRSTATPKNENTPLAFEL